MPDTALVMAGGAIGAMLRFQAARLIVPLVGGDWPASTLAVNCAGGLAMGLLAGLAERHGLAAGWSLFLGVGLLGGFTTFSAFSLEVVLLVQQGRWLAAAAYAAASVAGSVLLLALGLATVRAA